MFDTQYVRAGALLDIARDALFLRVRRIRRRHTKISQPDENVPKTVRKLRILSWASGFQVASNFVPQPVSWKKVLSVVFVLPL